MLKSERTAEKLNAVQKVACPQLDETRT